MLAFACLPAAAQAAAIQVTTPEDLASGGGKCSLREATIAANTDAALGGCPAGASGANTIEVPAGTYRLTIAPNSSSDGTGGALQISSPISLIGAGAGTTIIQQTQADRVIRTTSASAQISGVTVTAAGTVT